MGPEIGGAKFGCALNGNWHVVEFLLFCKRLCTVTFRIRKLKYFHQDLTIFDRSRYLCISQTEKKILLRLYVLCKQSVTVYVKRGLIQSSAHS